MQFLKAVPRRNSIMIEAATPVFTLNLQMVLAVLLLDKNVMLHIIIIIVTIKENYFIRISRKVALRCLMMNAAGLAGVNIFRLINVNAVHLKDLSAIPFTMECIVIPINYLYLIVFQIVVHRNKIQCAILTLNFRQ